MEIAAHLKPQSDRLNLLRGVPAFAALPPELSAVLAGKLREEQFAAGERIVTEGGEADRLFLVASGRAEVTTLGRADTSAPGNDATCRVKERSDVSPHSKTILATLGPGEMFGEIALLEPGQRRQATATALTPLTAWSLGAAAFEGLLSAHPELRAALAALAENLLTVKFLKQATPFAALDAARAQRLAERLQGRTVAAGQTIVRQGEPGEACYLIRSGSVEVLANAGAPDERRLSTLGRGMLFGEAALLTDAPRNATVRALEPGELLALRRADFLEAMGADKNVGLQMLELQRLRSRPRAIAGVLAERRQMADGETVTILKEPSCGLYYRLSDEGWFLWQRLDGRHTLRDLTVEFFVEFKRFAPAAIADILAGLAATGFVESCALRADVPDAALKPTIGQRSAQLARGILEWQCAMNHVDAPLTRLYRGGVRWLYTRPGQILLAAVAAAGLLVFLLQGLRAGDALRAADGGRLLLWLIPAYLFAIVVHEAGHAFTTKAFGREVPRVGLGWYWFGPVAFVDTSDMWLAERWPRIAVSLAGPYANVVLAGLAALGLGFTSNLVVRAALYQFALVSYLIVLFNFNPLLEYDGYYVLMDWLERPNLRPRALARLGAHWRGLFRQPGALKGHAVELVYAVGALLYVAFMAALTVVLYRLLAQQWMARLLPEAAAAALAWVLAGAVVALSGALVVSELRGERSR